MEALKVLNPQYRKEVVPGNNHPYMLALPAQQVYSYMMSRDSIVNYRKDLYGQRKVAEPASLSGDDDYSQEYTYETRTETVYHKVGRRETLSSIAKKYGVSTSSIRQSNGLGRKAGVSRGQKLKIVTTKRVKVAKKAEAEEPIEGAEQNEMIMIDDIGQDTTGDSAAASAPATSDKGKVTKLNIDSKGNITEVVEKPLARKKELAAKKEAAAKEASAKKEPAAKEPATTSYTVKAGDTLGKIATRYGVTVDELEAANNLKNSTIKLGDNLVIPAKGSAKAAAAAAKEPAAPRSFTYRVRTGDSLAKIASRNGTTIDAIKKANGLKDDDITIGQKLSIPGKESTAKKKPRRKKK